MLELFVIKSNNYFSNNLMYIKPKHQLSSVVIFMDSFMMYYNYLKSVVNYHNPDIFLLVILLIEDIIPYKLSSYSSVINLNILKTLFFSEEIINQDKSLLYMDSMIKSWKNMDAPLPGNILIKLLIIYH